jgi:hypothetical protein
MSCLPHVYEKHECSDYCHRNSERGFESARSYCGKCWRIVSNAQYLAKNSTHITGKCSERHVIPDSIYRRTVDYGCKRSSSYYNERWKARQLHQEAVIEANRQADMMMRQAYPIVPKCSTSIEARIKLMEEQNRLLRILAAA